MSKLRTKNVKREVNSLINDLDRTKDLILGAVCNHTNHFIDEDEDAQEINQLLEKIIIHLDELDSKIKQLPFHSSLEKEESVRLELT